MVEQAVDVMMTSEVGDDRAGRRHEQDHLGTVDPWFHPGPHPKPNLDRFIS